MAVSQSNFRISKFHYLSLNRYICYFLLLQISICLILIVALDDVHIAGEGFDPLVNLFAADVACAEHGVYFIRSDHLFVLGGDLGAALGNVQVAQDEGELTHLLFFRHLWCFITTVILSKIG